MISASDLPIAEQNRLAKVTIGDHVILVHSNGKRRDVLIQGLPGDATVVDAKLIWVDETGLVCGAKNVPYGRAEKGAHWELPQEAVSVQ